MTDSVPGLHHVTAISGAPQETVDFYTQVLGLRLVKTTVNFDDPGTYHLYFGDARGRPGTILTFFPWTQAASGRPGAGQATGVAFAAPRSALDAWRERLHDRDLEAEPTERFGDPVLRFTDPDGLPLEIVFDPDAGAVDGWAGGPWPADEALRGVHGATLPAVDLPHTAELLEEVFGWERAGETAERVRLRAPGSALGRALDLERRPSHSAGRTGRGTVHHLAFRARGADEQARLQTALRDRGLRVTDVKDRQYFQSVYFRDPKSTSGVLFEIATDGPGFLTDEDEDALGSTLRLPPWLEDRRDDIAAALPALDRPARASS
jgi:glyoxalase family protein